MYLFIQVTGRPRKNLFYTYRVFITGCSKLSKDMNQLEKLECSKATLFVFAQASRRQGALLVIGPKPYWALLGLTGLN